MISIIVGILAFLLVATYLTNPFSRLSIVRQPFVIDTSDGTFRVVTGQPLKTWCYRSIRQTGWVIGFEQVRTMRAALRQRKGA